MPAGMLIATGDRWHTALSQLGRKLIWDPAKQEFVGDDEAQPHAIEGDPRAVACVTARMRR